MNDSMTAHRFKNKEPERRSTRCRTDEPLDVDKASHPTSGRRGRVPTRRARRARPTRGNLLPPENEANQLGQHVVLSLLTDMDYQSNHRHSVRAQGGRSSR